MSEGGHLAGLERYVRPPELAVPAKAACKTRGFRAAAGDPQVMPDRSARCRARVQR